MQSEGSVSSQQSACLVQQNQEVEEIGSSKQSAVIVDSSEIKEAFEMIEEEEESITPEITITAMEKSITDGKDRPPYSFPSKSSIDPHS